MKKLLLIALYCIPLITQAGDGTYLSNGAVRLALAMLEAFEANPATELSLENALILDYLSVDKDRETVIEEINAFVDIPGTPELKPSPGKISYPGFRVFAINRKKNFDFANTPEEEREGGRFVLLFKANGTITDYKNVWIIESEAQEIFSQTNVDIAKAPYVFENEYVELGGTREQLRKRVERIAKGTTPKTSKLPGSRRDWFFATLWIAAALVAGIAGWFFIRKSRARA
ncbi:MAG: hypothetical protein V4733_01110 [Verrucomicrobiota bacterium]